MLIEDAGAEELVLLVVLLLLLQSLLATRARRQLSSLLFYDEAFLASVINDLEKISIASRLELGDICFIVANFFWCFVPSSGYSFLSLFNFVYDEGC